MNATARRVLHRASDYREFWHATYESVRELLSGDWFSQGGDAHVHLRFEKSGDFEMDCSETGRSFNGKYIVVALGDDHYLTLESKHGDTLVLRVDVLERHHAKFGIETDEPGELDLSKRRSQAAAA